LLTTLFSMWFIVADVLVLLNKGHVISM